MALLGVMFSSFADVSPRRVKARGVARDTGTWWLITLPASLHHLSLLPHACTALGPQMVAIGRAVQERGSAHFMAFAMGSICQATMVGSTPSPRVTIFSTAV